MQTSNITAPGKEQFPVIYCKERNTRSVFLVLITVLLWSFLAVFTTKLRHIPPFLQVAITLILAGLFNLPLVKTWKVPIATLAVGTLGIFGNLFFYYLAFQLAPPVEVNLINYLWPMLIVVMSPLFLQGYKLHAWHFLGVLLGLAGTFLIISGGKTAFSRGYSAGYLSAFLGALIWVVYSLQIKRMPRFNSGAVGGFSLLAGVLAMLIFLIQMQSGFPFPAIQPADWLYLFLMSLGPIALANLTWKLAIQGGDPGIVGSFSYLTPMLSTINLVLFGNQSISVTTIVAMVFILLGAMIGGMDTLTPGKKK
jgi:drug/metabolite transporter (DMT)-like permease